MLGMHWAGRNPEKVRRLVILNTGAFHLPKSKPLPWSLWLGRNTRLGTWLTRSRNWFCKKALKWCVKRKPLPDEVKRMYLLPYDTWDHRLAVLKFVQTIPLKPTDPGYDIVSETEADLAKLKEKPTLICWGMKDFVFDEHFLNVWREKCPNAEVKPFPDCGDHLREDAGHGVRSLVRDFLGRT